MATKKAAKQTGPARVDCKSFNGARRGVVLEKFTAQTVDRFFGAEFALIELDHYPSPVWSTTKFLKAPPKKDLYERLRADPDAAVRELVALDPVSLVRTVARVSGGQHSHCDGSMRWVGFARAMEPVAATEALVSLIERVRSSRDALALDEPAALDGSEYSKSDFKSGPNVRGEYVDFALRYALERLWTLEFSKGQKKLDAFLPGPLFARARALWPSDATLFDAPFEMPRLERFVGGLSTKFNKSCGLDEKHPLVQGTGY